MLAYLLQTETRVAPLGERPVELPVLGVTIAEHQRRALTQAGCQVRRVGSLDEVREFPCLLIHDDLFFSELVVPRFLRQVGSGAGQLVLADSQSARSAAPLQGVPHTEDGGSIYAFWRLRDAAELAKRDTLPRVVLAPSEWVRPLDLPHQFIAPGAPPPQAALSSIRVVRVRHWVHVLRTNIDSIGGVLRESWDRSKLSSVLHLLAAFVLRRLWRLALVPRGRGCKVHRTAIVEACRLGSNVTIGANAVVRGCVLGDGVTIADGAHVTASVLGAGAVVAANCVVFAAVLMERVFCGHRLTQASVLGRDAITTGGGYLVDLNFSGDIKVLDGDQLVSAGGNFLGCCLGHGVRMGTGVWVAAGRAIPNGYFLVQDPAVVLRRVPEGLPAGPPLRVHHGTLEPLA